MLEKYETCILINVNIFLKKPKFMKYLSMNICKYTFLLDFELNILSQLYYNNV